MKFNSSSKWALLMSLAILVAATSFIRTRVEAQDNDPQTVILKGRVVDLTCAVKGKVAMGSWNNIAEDHMMADGNLQKSCATLCLLGGQPAALFADNRITAVFACNPQGSGVAPHKGYTLAGNVAQASEVEGYWLDDNAGTGLFVPLKIRRAILTAERRYGSGGWLELDCGAMHE
jgi:hypothetical protein